MHVSFSGFLAPYVYNCPYSFKLRVIEKHYLPQIEPSEEPGTISHREAGIQKHDLVAAYLKGEIDCLDFTTDTIEWFKEQPNLVVEEQEFCGLDFSPLSQKPSDKTEHYMSVRRDAVVRNDDEVIQVDWKFGNPEYGSARHYDETEFFIAAESARNPEIGQWKSLIHFPEYDYTLPIRVYSAAKAARLQQKYILRINSILKDKFYRPNPGRARCKLCDHRSADTGGIGDCEYTYI